MKPVKRLCWLARKAAIRRGLVLALGLLHTGHTLAQLPELANPSTATGIPTSARFFGGNTPDNGTTYVESFAADQTVDIVMEIQPEPGHVGSSGNTYLIIALGEEYFMLAGAEFLAWDGELASLQAVASKPLAASEDITVVENIAFGPLGLSGVSMQIFLAYDSELVPGELYYSGVPLVSTIEGESGDAASFTWFVEQVSEPVIQANCIVCHVSGGVAGSTPLTYANSSVADYQLINYNTLMDYIENAPGGSSLILSKPQGTAHGGGVRLSPGSDELAAWTGFVNSALNDIASGGQGSSQQDIFASVALMNNEETLRKAAMLFAGRLPSAEELEGIADADESGLRQAIRSLMVGEGFRAFITESANDKLLTLALQNNMFAIVDPDRYPNSAAYFQVPGLRDERSDIAEALAREPLELIYHVAANERPYTEILTADYIMVNPLSAEIYGADVTFDNPDDASEWREGEITEYYRCTVCNPNNENKSFTIPTDYPHAGILNSPAFLSRYESTSTNRNRARSRWTYYYFLGVDIEGLAERTTDPDALEDEDNPTLNNPNCTVCHTIMDPVAGAFQNYGDEGFYKDKPGGNDSLPFSYKLDPDSDFMPGDTWFADMLAPGFQEALVPDADNSLQWLAQEFVKDPRFADGAVYFWYPAVVGEEPYPVPENPDDSDYAQSLAAYETQQAFIQQVSSDFAAGKAGNGEFNLKDMLVDLAMSEYFRANAVDEMTESQLVELENIGAGRLLSPEQLSRKLKSLTNYDWIYFGSFGALEDAYNLVYGGIDSVSITERATELTTLMSTVVVTMANETSCPIVAQDFALPQAERLLFPHVELGSQPGNDADGIIENIRYLHQRLLGEDLAADHIEIESSYSLFVEIWNARMAAGKGANVSTATELCIFENVDQAVQQDTNQTLRTWAAVLNYMLRDYRFIYD